MRIIGALRGRALGEKLKDKVQDNEKAVTDEESKFSGGSSGLGEGLVLSAFLEARNDYVTSSRTIAHRRDFV